MDEKDTCLAEGCDRSAHARGLCKSVHYSRWCRDQKNAGQKQSFKLTHEENFLRFPLMKEGECEVWTRSRDEHGYGRIGGYRAGTRFAHRVAMEIAIGRRLLEEEFVLHTCDNPPCCKRQHLYIGDQPQNVEDARLRDRVQHGEKHWKRRLTEDDVRQIREWAGYMSQREMGRRLGVHDNTIRDVIKGRTWVRVK